MRKLLAIALLWSCATWMAAAQTNGIDPVAVQQATDELTALYHLDNAQVQKMHTIQERRFRNLAEIEPLKTQDYSVFLAKRKAIVTGTDGSIKRMLHEEQLVIFNNQIAERRKQESDLIRELREKGASKEEIQQAISEQIY